MWYRMWSIAGTHAFHMQPLGGGGVTRCLHVRADKGTREGVRGFTQTHAGGVRGGIRTSLT